MTPREVDREVAIKIMGLPESLMDDDNSNVAPYSTSIQDAWLVVERMSGKFGFQLTKIRDPLYPAGSYQAEFIGSQFNYIKTGNSSTEAICLAALAALKGTRE